MTLDVAISKRLPGFHLDVRFAAGREPVALLGPSGCGKTMTLRAIAGLLRPDSGRIVLDDRVLFDSTAGVNVPARARRVGLVFQNYALFPHLTVEQNVAYGLTDLAETPRAQGVREHLERMQLEQVAGHYPRQLSGGQQQRVALARALAPDPAVLLLDEPLSALDLHLRGQVEKQLIEVLAGYRGIAILVSHDLPEAYRICKRLVVLDGGRCIADGDTDEIFRRPPTVAVARVTGCKNFSRARKTAPDRLDALDWDCTLRFSQPLPASVGHVAIRAHHVRLSQAADSFGSPADNEFLCWAATVTEGPFDVTLYLRLNAPPASATDYHLQAEISRDSWAELKSRAFPWTVRLAPDQLIPLPD